MAAITAPVAIDENIVKISSSLTAPRLTGILKQLSHNAATNARVIVSIQHGIEEIRNTMLKDEDAVQRRFDVEARQRVQLEDMLIQQKKKIAELEQSHARRDYVDEKLSKIAGEISRAVNFIEEIENGTGKRVTEFVSNYIQAFIPKWYAGVSKDIYTNVNTIVQATASEAASNLEKRAQECEQKAEQDANKMQSMIVKSMYSLNEDRRRDVSKLRTEIYDRISESDSRTDQITAHASFIQERRHGATRRRLQNLEESASALRTTMCLEDELCRELHNLTVSQTFQGDVVRTSSSRVAGRAELIPDDKELDSGSPGEHRRADCSELFAKMSVDDCVRDARVRRIALTPHWIGLRAAMQKEFAERMEFLKTDLHNDLVNEIFDLQRELRGKVGTNKLGELLDQYRDEALYSNVKLLMHDMTDMKANKVDMVLFVEGLRSKADVRVVDNKVDRTTVDLQMESLDRKVDSLFATSARHESRMMKVENTIVNPRRGTLAVKPGEASDVSPAMAIEDRRTSAKGAKSLRRGTHRQGSTSPRLVSPRQSVTSPLTGRDTTSPAVGGEGGEAFFSAFSGGDGPTVSGVKQLPSSGGSKAVQNLVDQIVERGFPAHVVVHESRDLSKLHHTVVKSSHNKQVAELMSADPDVESLPVIPPQQNISTSTAYVASPRKAHTAAVGYRGTHRQQRSAERVTVVGEQRNPSTKPALIPLTNSQEAYCSALGTDAPQTTGSGIALGMKIGEKREY